MLESKPEVYLIMRHYVKSFFGIKQKEEQAMQPTTTPTAPTGLPESSSEVQPQATPAPVVQEPKKAPEIKITYPMMPQIDNHSGTIFETNSK